MADELLAHRSPRADAGASGHWQFIIDEIPPKRDLIDKLRLHLYSPIRWCFHYHIINVIFSENNWSQTPFPLTIF